MEWQGVVESKEREDMFLVQLFSWITGYNTDKILVSLDDMKEWRFYDTSDDLIFAYNQYEANKKSTIKGE